MNSPPKDYKVGYKRPPEATRWKKGQSGNPLNRRRVATLSPLEAIDRQLLRSIEITENGVPKKVTVLAAIMLQLWQKEIVGDKRAFDVRLKYEEIARETVERGVEIGIVDSDYARALAKGQQPKAGEDE